MRDERPEFHGGSQSSESRELTPLPCVFIHTNHRQLIGALVSAYSLRRNSTHADRFTVRIIHHDDHRFLAAREGQYYLRDGMKHPWRNDDLQSFTPLRFMPPELMGYRGRALVIDPDVFAVGDVYDLLDGDMQGKALMCRPRGGYKSACGCLASSVMLLDCAKLTHWRCREQFDELFEFKRDYARWMCLAYEARDNIGLFEEEWNDFDHLSDKTKLLHNTRRLTQPWKTGLPADFMPPESFPPFPPIGWILRARRLLFGDYGLLPRYRRHPDPRQEQFFFELLRECIENGIITLEFLRGEIRQNHVRHDALAVLERVRLGIS